MGQLNCSVEETQKNLNNNGYVYYHNLGWVKKDRLDFCIGKGYIRPTGSDMFYTYRMAPDSVQKYLAYKINNFDSAEKDIKNTEEKKQGKRYVADIFGDM